MYLNALTMGEYIYFTSQTKLFVGSNCKIGRERVHIIEGVLKSDSKRKNALEFHFFYYIRRPQNTSHGASFRLWAGGSDG